MNGEIADYHVLADVVLVVHFLFVVFVVGGLAVIWLGAWCRWEWTRKPWFRWVHLAAILFVACTSLFGVLCPLTVLEDHLRGLSDVGPGFIARWLSRWLYYDFPAWVFTAVYLAFAVLVVATFWLVPPRHGGKHGS